VRGTDEELDPLSAVAKVMTDHIKPILEASLFKDVDEWRDARMYNEETSCALLDNEAPLRRLYVANCKVSLGIGSAGDAGDDAGGASNAQTPRCAVQAGGVATAAERARAHGFATRGPEGQTPDPPPPPCLCPLTLPRLPCPHIALSRSRCPRRPCRPPLSEFHAVLSGWDGPFPLASLPPTPSDSTSTA
jgi:hypothetical protein